MTPEALRELFAYFYWAAERVWGCVMQLDDEQFTQPIDYSVGSIRHQIVHVMSGTYRWIKRLQGGAIPPHLAYEDYSTRAATRAKWDELKAEILAYIESLDQAGLDEWVTWELPQRGMTRANCRWELLLHVANHATDHRAQILTLLHVHFGAATVEQDLIFYLAE